MPSLHARIFIIGSSPGRASVSEERHFSVIALYMRENILLSFSAFLLVMTKIGQAYSVDIAIFSFSEMENNVTAFCFSLFQMVCKGAIPDVPA